MTESHRPPVCGGEREDEDEATPTDDHSGRWWKRAASLLISDPF